MNNFFIETIKNLDGHQVTRLRSSIFYISAPILFFSGVYMFLDGIFVGTVLAFIAAPCFALYPMVRYLLGGKDSIMSVVTTVVVEEVLKGQIKSSVEKRSQKKKR